MKIKPGIKIGEYRAAYNVFDNCAYMATFATVFNKLPMKKSTKALLYNFLGFAPIFIIMYYLAQEFTGLGSFMKPLAAFVVTTILAPKFQAGKVHGEEKLFMRWMFIKGVKEIK